jgi:hypothetical protein
MRNISAGILILIVITFGYSLENKKIALKKDDFKTIQVSDMSFSWKVSGKNLQVKVIAPVKGWVGVGFDPESDMLGANFILGYFVNNRLICEDHYGVSAFSHKKDSELGGKDNILEMLGRQNKQRTEIGFTIPLDSGDKYDKPLVPGKTYKILLAYGLLDKIIFKHIHRYSTNIIL